MSENSLDTTVSKYGVLFYVIKEAVKKINVKRNIDMDDDRLSNIISNKLVAKSGNLLEEKMINYFDVLAGTISSYIKVNKILPDINIAPNSSLGMSTQRLISNGFTTANEEESNKILQTLNNVAANISNPLYQADVETLNNIVDAYVIQITNSFNILNFIKSSVDEIKAKVEASINEMASVSDVLVKYDIVDKAAFKSDFTMMPWEDINKIGTPFFVTSQLKDIVSYFEKNTNVELNTTVFTITYNSILGFYKEKVISTVAGSPEQFNRLVDYCHAKTEISRDTIVKYATTLMDGNMLASWGNLIRSNFRVDSIDCSSIMSTIFEITNMNEIISIITNKECVEAVAFNVEQNSVITENIEYITPTILLGYVFVSAMRNSFKNRLILSTQVINPDGLIEFKKSGKDERDIAAFLYAKNMQKVPDQGIYTDAVLASIESVNKNLETDKASLGRMAKLELNKIKHKAFVHHMTLFMKALSTEPKISNLESYIRHMGDDYIGLDGSLENAIYGVIINAEYGNTFIQTLYDKLGKAYVEVLSKVNEADATIISETENGVIANIIIEHALTVLSTIQ